MGLTCKGIAAQIVSALVTHKVYDLGTINDCKVVLNHLIRKFDEPLRKDGELKRYQSKASKISTEVVRDHRVPVLDIMEELLRDNSWELSSEKVDDVCRILKERIAIVEISPEEDQKLNICGLQRKMPVGYESRGHELFRDDWARYKVAGIYSSIEPTMEAP